MFQIIPSNLNINFVGKKSRFYWISVLLMISSIVIIAVMKPNYGIDFRGGTDIVLDFDNDTTVEDVRDAATKAGFPDANVQTYGTGDHLQYLVQTLEVSVVNPKSIEAIKGALEPIDGFEAAKWDPTHPDRLQIRATKALDQSAILSAISSVGIDGTTLEEQNTNDDNLFIYNAKFEELSQKVRDGFSKAMGDKFNPETGLVRLETVGPRAGEQLRNSALLSVVATLIMLLIYISIRFDFRYAPGAILGLVHDVLICWAFLVLFQLEISLTTVAAMLTIIGYSLNDTIIIFDRIRENLTAQGGSNIIELVNKSTNETLSRTIITSFTTLLAVVSLAVFTTGNIQDFALTLLVGIIAGTASTLFLATPVMVWMDEYIQTRRKSKAIALADQPEEA